MSESKEMVRGTFLQLYFDYKVLGVLLSFIQLLVGQENMAPFTYAYAHIILQLQLRQQVYH